MDVDNAPLYPDQQFATQPPKPPPHEDMSRHDDTVSQYTLTVEEASQAFKNAGLPRSPRTVIRYCSLKHLDCIKVDTERNEKYLVSPSSVHARIEELQQVMAASHVAPRPDITRRDESYPNMSGYNETRPDMARNVDNEYAKQLESRVGELERENEELKYKNRDLEITNRVKDNVIKEGKQQLGSARTQLMRFSRAVGELATILRLKAPEHDTSQIIAYIDAPTDEPNQKDENLGVSHLLHMAFRLVPCGS
jgi:hypothetical protein